MKEIFRFFHKCFFALQKFKSFFILSIFFDALLQGIDEVLVIPPSRASLFVYYRFAKSLTKYSFSASFQLVRVFEQWKRAYIPYLCGIPNRYHPSANVCQ